MVGYILEGLGFRALNRKKDLIVNTFELAWTAD
jgi:hypothetical protein